MHFWFSKLEFAVEHVGRLASNPDVVGLLADGHPRLVLKNKLDPTVDCCETGRPRFTFLREEYMLWGHIPECCSQWQDLTSTFMSGPY